MKIRKVGVMIAALLFALSFSFVSYAREDVPENDWEVCFYYGEDSVLMPENVTSSNSMENVQPRGTLISTAVTQIFNAGGGKIDVLIETLAHVTVDEIRHKAYLDIWDDSDNSWININDYLFVDTNTASLTNSFTISGAKTNRYYRLRGTHMVTKGSESQTFSSQTNGVLITK